MMARWPLHPILLAIFPIVSIYQANTGFARLQELWSPVAISAAAAGVIWMIIAAATRQVRRAGLMTSILVFVFFGVGYGPKIASHVSTWMSGFWVDRQIWVGSAVMAAMLLPAALAASVAIWRTGRDLRKIDAPLNLMALVLVGLPGMIIGIEARAASLAATFQGGPLFVPSRTTPAARPDVYYVIVDGYARADVLRRLFGFDNTPFLRALEGRGFVLANKSTSNYMQTSMSLASSLNAGFLDDLAGTTSDDRDLLRQRIGGSRVAATFRRLGYRYVGFDSGFDITDLRGYADDFRSPFPRRSPFHDFLIDATPFCWFRAPLNLPNQYEGARARFQMSLDELAPLAADDRPTFALARIVSPHPPFLFKADGTPYEQPGATYHLVDGNVFHRDYGDDADYVAGYTEQLRYLNRRLIDTVDAILAASPPNRPSPLIILQSDHGSGLNYDLYHVEKTDLRERFGNLTAVRWPDPRSRPAALSDSVTPVNLFRIVFDGLFNADLPLLPDRCYYSTFGDPYHFVEVTDEVRPNNAIRSRRAHRTKPDPSWTDAEK